MQAVSHLRILEAGKFYAARILRALRRKYSNILPFTSKKKYTALEAKNKALNLRNNKLKELVEAGASLKPISVQLQLADAVARIGEDVRSDCYIALLPSALPAAFDLRDRWGGLVVCDVVENIDVDKHSLAPRWDPRVTRLVNSCARGGLTTADKLMTIGTALENGLRPLQRPTLVLRNFRCFEEPRPARSLRAKCGIPQADTVLFASGNVVIGFEAVLGAIRQLPTSFHLVALVRLKPQSYEKKIRDLISEYGLSARVHLLPFVEYEELASTAAAGDIGLITSDVSNPNGAVGLPNRCFDYITAGLPVVSPPMPDVVQLNDQFNFGQIVSPTTADGWAHAILAVANRLQEYKRNAIAARHVLTWESQEEALFEFLGRPKSATLLSFRDLSRYQRYRRLTRSLQDRGCSIKKVFWSREIDYKGLQSGVLHYWIHDIRSAEHGVTRIST